MHALARLLTVCWCNNEQLGSLLVKQAVPSVLLEIFKHDSKSEVFTLLNRATAEMTGLFSAESIDTQLLAFFKSPSQVFCTTSIEFNSSVNHRSDSFEMGAMKLASRFAFSLSLITARDILFWWPCNVMIPKTLKEFYKNCTREGPSFPL